MVFDLEGTLLHAEALEALRFAHAASVRPDLDETELASSYRESLDRLRREARIVPSEQFGLERAAGDGASGTQTSWQLPADLDLSAYDEALADTTAILLHSYPRNAALIRELRRSGRLTALCTDLSRRQAERGDGAGSRDEERRVHHPAHAATLPRFGGPARTWPGRGRPPRSL